MQDALKASMLVVFARAPEPGRVKTRLISAIGTQRASDLHGWMLEATLRRVQTLSFHERVLAVTPDPACTAMRQAWSPTFHVIPQGRGSLGDRMARITEHAFCGSRRQTRRGRGAPRPVLVIGTDAPDLPAATLIGAAEAAGRGQAAICPARDGGYCLIALPRPLPALFGLDPPSGVGPANGRAERVDWGTDRVCEQTCRAARAAGVTLCELPPWEDVDRIEDVARLGRRLAATPDPALRQLHARLVSAKLVRPEG
jgi:rSAM/selenodomain-associated transferase 1